MKEKDYTVGKNVTLKNYHVDMIFTYSNRTRKNFSQTLQIILDEWDKLSIIKMKLDAEKEKKQLDLRNQEIKSDAKYIEAVGKGKVIKK